MADKHIPASQIRKVWLDSSLTTAQAAAEVGLSRSNLWHRAKHLGLPQRKQGNRYLNLDADQLRDLWIAGVDGNEIARHFGCSRAAISAWCGRLGLPPRPNGGRRRYLTMAEYRELKLAEKMRDQAAVEYAARKARG
ncbi:MerR family transcriptional regulator [Acidimangrovimonas sediminis]|uniref:MerR family transcriptional regulator n=1 Tax=Acidimangrovimonas sediminis TaxID=2056283 RepID=UPI0011AF9B32|nr:MerR family transcriptional regulator [Acidimangrovimonas sediminis]